MKKLLFISLFAALLAAGCSKDEGPEDPGNNPPTEQEDPNTTPDADPDGAIEFPEAVVPELPVFSSDGQTQSITFTATAAWQATVTESRAESWCWVEPSSGEAGEVTMNIITLPNDTGEERSADIIIICGESKQTLSVTQDSASIPDDKIPDNEIHYTSSTGDIVEPANVNFGGAEIISNTYEDGKGVIEFNAPVTEIGQMAFRRCVLTSITIPNSVTTIEGSAFYECMRLTSIDIPDGVTTIGASAFTSCHALTSITIPDNVTAIGNSAFAYCDGLTSIYIPDSVTEIGGKAFERCSSLAAIYGKFASEDNRCLIVDGVLNSFAPAGLTEYAIPDGVTEIGDSAFYSCSGLTSINIPDGVTEIGLNTFSGCSSLESITIPGSVTEIGNSAFSGCSNLTSITIPDGVTTIEVLTFFGCSGLTSITIPDGVTKIGDSAFYNCTSLTTVTIPDNVEEIGQTAFLNCTSLTSATIGNSVTTIGGSAFAYCPNLTSVYCRATTPPNMERSNVFYDDNGILENLTAIYVPHASVEAYKVAENWSEYADLIQGYDF